MTDTVKAGLERYLEGRAKRFTPGTAMAGQIIAKAREEADEIIHEARQKAYAIAQEAEAERQRVTAEMQQEITELHEQRKQLRFQNAAHKRALNKVLESLEVAKAQTIRILDDAREEARGIIQGAREEKQRIDLVSGPERLQAAAEEASMWGRRKKKAA